MNKGKIAKKGGNRIFKIERSEGRMNRHFMVVLPGAEYTNIKWLKGVRQMGGEPEELDIMFASL